MVITPALYETTIGHTRQSPFKHAFSYKSYWWLVDLDHLDVLPRGLRALARFRAEDHVGDPALPIRANIDALLAAEGVSAHRVLMLTNARTLGHVFNPITVHWCLSGHDEVVAVVTEVHNTYGGRHAYVLRTDADDRSAVDKSFYVSPFHPVDGRYEMRLPLPEEQLRVDLTYRRSEGKPFVATVRGERSDVSVSKVLGLALRHPFSTRVVSARIRIQGIRLWLRKLPVIPRTTIQPSPTIVGHHREHSA